MNNKKINYKTLAFCLFLCISATAISSFGIGCYYGCGLGTDPISVFVDGLHNKCGLSYGTISTICNVILAILMFLFERKSLGIGTIIGVFAGGPLIDVFETLVRVNFPSDTLTFVGRIILLIIGLLTTGIGYGMQIACDQGAGCFQFCPIFVADKFKIDIKYAQIITDAIFFVIGWLLGGVIGIGSVVAVFLTGYVLGYAIDKTNKIKEVFGPMYLE